MIFDLPIVFTILEYMCFGINNTKRNCATVNFWLKPLQLKLHMQKCKILLSKADKLKDDSFFLFDLIFYCC